MKQITFSVVIPLYNKARSVTETLESVLAQKHMPEEIIVVNDGSTDDSVSVVQSLAIPNLKLIEQPNQGVSSARNRGVQQAKCPYVAFLDADDLWSPFYLTKMKALIERFPQSHCYGSGYQKRHENDTFSLPKLHCGLNPEGSLLQDYFKIVSNGDLPFMISSSVFEKTFYQSIGGCPLGESMGEDQTLFANAALKTDIAYSPLILLTYRTESENRACDRVPPAEPLNLVKRLTIRSENSPLTLRQDLLKYAGAIVCHLAKRNLQSGRASIAKTLLKEPTARHKPLHWFLLSLACEIQQTLNKYKILKGEWV